MATSGKRGAEDISPGTAPLIILLVVAAMIVFYVITVTPEEREALIGHVDVPGVPENKVSLVDVSPGLVEGIPEAQMTRHTHSFVTFAVDNTPQSVQKPLATNFLVKKSIVADTPANFDFLISGKPSLASADLEFIVADKKEKGELSVVLNEKTVYSAKPEPGQKLVVALPIDSLVEGTNNVKIYAAGSGLRFWATNLYSLSDINLVTYSYSDEDAGVTQKLVLSQEELAYAKSAKLTAFVRQASATPAKLSVKLNGAEIYNSLVNGNAALYAGVSASKLLGTNTLTWNAGRGGKYEVEFGRFTVIASPVNSKEKSYSFTVIYEDGIFITAGIYDCTLEMTKSKTSSSSKDTVPSVDVNINGAVNTYTFTADKITADVCSSLKEGANTVKLSSTDDIIVDGLKITLTQRA
ncbi:MAG: hypothetical protein V1839_04245 [archaeon]